MAGLLAWAADVVGRGGQSEDDNSDNAYSKIPLIFTPEQEQYVRELDQKAACLSRSIQDLRLRIPPPDISERLPDLHAHSLASNAALALQLNAHSSTREQAQEREVQLQEENAAYENAISNCQTKIQEKVEEVELLKKRLENLEISESHLRVELENAQAATNIGQHAEPFIEPGKFSEAQAGEEDLKYAALEKLESKKQELRSVEETVQNLEKRWAEIQDTAMKLPTPAQREKALDKQLHSLIEQLAGKQAQAEGIASEIHVNEMELERLNGLWRRIDSNNTEVNAARNRFARNSSGSGYASVDSYVDEKLPYHIGGRSENLQRVRVLRASFVIYILLLHILVFIKISF